MKYLILVFTFLFSVNALADYKIQFTNQRLSIPEVDESEWEPPAGEPALHPNGVTVTCLGMSDGSIFDLKEKTYRVVYTKEDAATYASTACTSNIVDLSYTFRDMPNFNENISHWDTSSVKKMDWMFYESEEFNQNINDWDTSSLNNMYAMFAGSKSFNKPLNNWNTSNVSNMGSLFSRSVFNQDIGNWDISNVNNISFIFNDSVFNKSIVNWDVSNVISMRNMVSKNYDFNQDLSSWCVEKIDEEPFQFYSGDLYWSLPKPNWGACPQ